MRRYFIGAHADFLGFTASLLCAVHCLGLPLLLSSLPMIGIAYLNNNSIENGIIMMSFTIAGYALWNGYKKCRKNELPIVLALIGSILIGVGRVSIFEANEIIVTSSGALLLSMAHFTNWRIINKSRSINHS